MKKIFYLFSCNRYSCFLCVLLSVFCSASNSLLAQITISTVAGYGVSGYSGDGGPATTASVVNITGLSADGSGNFYISDGNSNVVRKVNHLGIITTIAGTGVMGWTGDGGPATAARFYSPGSTAIDRHGNIYISDQLNCRIRKIDAAGILSTFAGSSCGNTGNGGPATSAQIGKPQQMVISPAGDMYFVDGYYQSVRKINSSGIISAVAGIFATGFSGDGGPATAAIFHTPYGITMDPAGNLYISDYVNRRIRKVNTAGIISTYAGTGVMGFSGDGGPATAAQLGGPAGLACDAIGNIFVGDALNRRVRKIDTSGIISTVAGNGSGTFSGDGGHPLLAGVGPFEIFLINDSSFYTTDAGRIRFVGLPPCTGVPTAGTLAATTTTGCGAYTPQLSLMGTTAASRIIYKWQSSADTIAWVPVAGATNATYTPTITTPIYYRCIVVCNASGFSDTTNSLFLDNLIPVLSPISGTSAICPGATTTYTDTATGGTWSSSNLSVATINPTTGLINGISPGTATITYTKTNACGISAVVQIITVNPPPDAGTITGTAVVCPTATTALGISGGDAGGIWTSASTLVATIGTSSGTVTGVSPGTAIISYTVTNVCGTLTATTVVTVSNLPVAGTLTGIAVVCHGATGGLSVLGGDAGGIWSSSIPANATVNPVSGVFTGIALGTSVISYTVINSCSSATASATISVNPLPNAGTISGTATVCPTATITLASSGDAGGVWSSVTTTVATINPSTGVVTGVSTGTTLISYLASNSCGIAIATRVATVDALPDAGTITGTAIVCEGATTILSNPTGDPGGSWSSVTPANATVGMGTGLVTGIFTGTTLISYTVTNICATAATIRVVTINPLPNAGAIAGSFNVCTASTTTLANAAPGGVWSSTFTGIATIGLSGIVTGVAAGTTTISYTVTNSCGTAAATTVVTVSTPPVGGAITGSTPVCPSGSIALSNPSGTPGGAWTSVTPAVATINSSTGIVTGVISGTTLISYAFTNICGTVAATTVVTVSLVPNAGVVTGTATVCSGSTTLLSSTLSGGVWTSSAPIRATVDASGLVSGVSVGTSTISYSVTNSCGIAVAIRVVTVNTVPAVGVVTGLPTVCQGLTTTLSNGVPGGVWSSSAPAIANVSVTGIVTGIASGIANISYGVTNGCGTNYATRNVTVNVLPAPIDGTTNLCVGGTVILTDATAGGTWSRSNMNVTIGLGSGIVNGITAGTTIITYSLPTTCLITTIVTVNSLPMVNAVTGGGSYCESGSGVSVGLVSSQSGINYQLYQGATTVGAALAGTGAALDFGLITAVGTYTILATNITTGCTQNMIGSATVVIVPNVVPSVNITPSFSGPSTCNGTIVTFTAITVNGGAAPTYQWYVNGTPVGIGTNNYTYAPVNGDVVSVTVFPAGICVSPTTVSSTYTVSVLPMSMPSVSVSISPGNPVCKGALTTFTAIPVNGGSAPTYLWTKNGINVATGPYYIYVPVNGDVIVATLTSSNICRLVDNVTSVPVIMSVQVGMSAPVVSIAASPSNIVAAGTMVTLSATAMGGTATKLYQWFVNGMVIAGATNAVYSSNAFSNGDIITCQVINNDACANSNLASMNIYIHGLSIVEPSKTTGIHIYPDPNSGEFVVSGIFANSFLNTASLTITNTLGQVVYMDEVAIKDGTINTRVKMNSMLANGMYLLHILAGDERNVLRFILGR